MAAIARLRITLDFVKPQVLRRLDVPLTIRLDRLHLVLQAALGWTNSHLWEIRAGGSGWGPKSEDDWADGPLDAGKTRLIDVLEDTGTKTLHYLYDFGDGWEHTIKIERILDPAPGLQYPVFLKPKDAVRPKTLAVRPARKSSSKPQPTRSIPAMTNSWNGTAKPSTQTKSMSKRSMPKFRRSRKNGCPNHASRPHAAPDPRGQGSWMATRLGPLLHPIRWRKSPPSLNFSLDESWGNVTYSRAKGRFERGEPKSCNALSRVPREAMIRGLYICRPGKYARPRGRRKI